MPSMSGPVRPAPLLLRSHFIPSSSSPGPLDPADRMTSVDLPMVTNKPLAVRSFEAWSQANGRAQPLPLSVLKDSILGIEAHHYLNRTVSGSASITEPLVCALGGVPFSLKETIEADLAKLTEANIEPVFVFSGCTITRNEKPFAVPDESATRRDKAWSLYDQGKAQESVEAFTHAGSIAPPELFRMFMNILLNKKVKFYVAPYAAWPQLVYLEQKCYIDAICGDSELFLFDVDKVIVNLDLNNNKIMWVSKTRLRDNTQLSSEQFVDACLLAGTRFLRTYPPLESSPTAFLDALSLLKRYRSAGHLISTHSEPPAGYLEKFRRARAAVHHHVIMNEDGKVEQMHYDSSPSDVHEFIGQRLPEELYFYLSRGVVGPQVLDMLVTGELVQQAPLDNGDSDEYKKFLSGLSAMRTESLSLLAKSLHRYWMNKEVKVFTWFDTKNPKSLMHKDIQHPSDKAQKWNVREEVYLPEYEKPIPGDSMTQEDCSSELSFAVKVLESEEFATKSVTPKDPSKLLETGEEIRLNTIWRMLQMRNYVEGDGHKLTVWGRALSAAFTSLQISEDHYNDAVFLAFELLRMKAFKPINYAPQMSGAPALKNEGDNNNIFLVSRVASLLPLEHEPVGYTGVLNRNILSFSSMTRLLTKELRNYLEMTLVNLLMTGDANREDRSDWSSLSLKLPFVEEANICLGIVTKTYLEAVCRSDDINKKVTDEKKADLSKMFPNAIDIDFDLDSGFALWDSLVAGVRVLEKEGVYPEECKQILRVDEWLSIRKPR